MKLTEIRFPVYLVRVPITKVGDKLLFIGVDEKVKYLDDKDVVGDTLGLRRLQIAETDKKLLKLSTALYFIKDIIKLNDSKIQFIDSNGKLFKYTKKTMVALVFKEITKVIPILTGGALIEVEGEFPRYKVMYAPNHYEKYLGLLRVSKNAYLVYGLYDKKYKDTIRKI